ncbi:hypothetical protein D3C76_1499410 [compost metagenome]
MSKADDVPAIARHKAVLAVLHGHVQVRAQVSIDTHLATPAQRKHGVTPLAPGVESTGKAFLQLVVVAKQCQILGHGDLDNSGVSA